jgi:hypothetical protein
MASIRKSLPVKYLGITLALLFPLWTTPAFALTQGDLVSGGSIWLETTIAVALAFVAAMAFCLQVARGYFIRVLNKFTLRLGADIWWVAYVLIRDALIFISFIMGLLVFFPGTFLDYPIAVPFMPLSVVLFGLALITKLYFDADDNRNAYMAVTGFVAAGALLWIFGTVFITESPLKHWEEHMEHMTLPPGVSEESGFWSYLYNTFGSTNNLALAMTTFYVTFAALGILAILGLAHPILHSRLPKLKRAVTPSPATPVSSPPPSVSKAFSAGQESAQVGRIEPARTTNAVQQRTREKVDYIA